MKRNILLIIGIIVFSSVNLRAQEGIFIEKDSIHVSGKRTMLPDSVAISVMDLLKPQAFSPKPTRALLFAAVMPGMGQIYNRKYWKLPLVYGSVLGCIYAVTWNGTQYRGYRNAYRDLYDPDPEKNSWRDYNYKYYGGTDEEPDKWSPSAKQQFGERLKSGKDNFRRNLELSYIISVGVHLIWMIDAYVDAQLFEFDVSEDLSFRVEPVLFDRTPASSRTLGLQCSITF